MAARRQRGQSPGSRSCRSRDTGFQTRDVAWSGGRRPISVTVHGRLVYVLNDETDNVFGFRLKPLVGRAEAHQAFLSATFGERHRSPQVEFAPNGRHLVVTEKKHEPDRRLQGARWRSPSAVPTCRHRRAKVRSASASSGRAPDVSEAFGGAPGASAVSSYRVGVHGSLETISPSVPDRQTAACWIVSRPMGGSRTRPTPAATTSPGIRSIQRNADPAPAHVPGRRWPDRCGAGEELLPLCAERRVVRHQRVLHRPRWIAQRDRRCIRAAGDGRRPRSEVARRNGAGWRPQLRPPPCSGRSQGFPVRSSVSIIGVTTRVSVARRWDGSLHPTRVLRGSPSGPVDALCQTNYLRTMRRLSLAVREELAGRIASGVIPRAAASPRAAFAEDLGVSRATLREALRSLEEDGFVTRRRGAGTFAAHRPRLRNNLDVNFGVTEAIRASGMRPGPIHQPRVAPAARRRPRRSNP